MSRFHRLVQLPVIRGHSSVPVEILSGVDPSGSGVHSLPEGSLEDIRPLADRQVGDVVYLQRPIDREWCRATVVSEVFIPGDAGGRMLVALSILHERGVIREGEDYVWVKGGIIRLALSSCVEKLQRYAAATTVEVSSVKAARSALDSRGYVLSTDVRLKLASGAFVRGVEIDQDHAAAVVDGFLKLSTTIPRTRGGKRPGSGRKPRQQGETCQA